jgi:SAM-dependent methyltransferase
MVEEAREQARRGRLLVEVLQADAQVLPFPAASFSRAMANHMLYHVPDQLAALRELRRVTKPGGRVVMATVGADQNDRLIRLHREVAGELGLRSATGAGARFTLAHLDLVRQVFPDARVEVRRDAFVFPEAEPALRYYASGLVDAIDDPPVDQGHRASLVDGMRQRIDAIIAREGVFRVPKDAGCFLADL